MTASVRRNEDQQTQSPSPSQVPKDKIFIRKMEARLAWGGGWRRREKDAHFFQGTSDLWTTSCQIVVNPAQAHWLHQGERKHKEIHGLLSPGAKQHTIAYGEW